MSQAVLEIFKKTGALLEGHFLLTSGLHSPHYWEKFSVLQYPEFTEQLCRLIAKHYKKVNIQLVAGPTTGGVILAYVTARYLRVRSIFAEKEGNRRIFRRGFQIKPNERVLVVDDIFTTGGSVLEVIDAVKQMGGNVIGAGVLVDRSDKHIDIGVPLFSCLKSETPTYRPDECPLCAEGVPLVRPGG
ncbi:MAG: orotate phosphoribosyltransferase [Dehalococcoidia bacterium]|nr:orotate phosphoribosyltransferase [Dehalococcoidia bacterium]MDD5493057.1 orotate phosphoribosyltransferase [Dehalococcoidia bacterium]